MAIFTNRYGVVNQFNFNLFPQASIIAKKVNVWSSQVEIMNTNETLNHGWRTLWKYSTCHHKYVFVLVYVELQNSIVHEQKP